MLDPLHDSAHDGVCVWFSLCETDILRHLCAGEHIWIVYDTDDFPQDYINRTAELCEQSSTEETES